MQGSRLAYRTFRWGTGEILNRVKVEPYMPGHCTHSILSAMLLTLYICTDSLPLHRSTLSLRALHCCVQPAEQTTKSRREHLRKQFGFSCQCTTCYRGSNGSSSGGNETGGRGAAAGAGAAGGVAGAAGGEAAGGRAAAEAGLQLLVDTEARITDLEVRRETIKEKIGSESKAEGRREKETEGARGDGGGSKMGGEEGRDGRGGEMWSSLVCDSLAEVTSLRTTASTVSPSNDARPSSSPSSSSSVSPFASPSISPSAPSSTSSSAASSASSSTSSSWDHFPSNDALVLLARATRLAAEICGDALASPSSSSTSSSSSSPSSSPSSSWARLAAAARGFFAAATPPVRGDRGGGGGDGDGDDGGGGGGGGGGDSDGGDGTFGTLDTRTVVALLFLRLNLDLQEMQMRDDYLGTYMEGVRNTLE